MENNSNQSNRVSIIETIKTPLGFFTLTVLIIEVILGIVANFSQGADRTYLIMGMITLIFLLVVIVAVFAFFRPEALRGKRPVGNRSVQISTRIQPRGDLRKVINVIETKLINSGKEGTNDLREHVLNAKKFILDTTLTAERANIIHPLDIPNSYHNALYQRLRNKEISYRRVEVIYPPKRDWNMQ